MCVYVFDSCSFRVANDGIFDTPFVNFKHGNTFESLRFLKAGKGGSPFNGKCRAMIDFLRSLTFEMCPLICI